MAGAIGWTPRDFWAATFPEFIFFFRGWQRSQGIDPDSGRPVHTGPQPITSKELEELDRQLEQAERKRNG